MTKDYQSIDFDLSLNDYRKSLVLVKYLNDLNDDFNNDYTHASEYDGSLGTHSINDNCRFCTFYNLIQNNYSKIEINNSFINSIVKSSISSGSIQQQNSKSYVYVRYKTINYPKQLLDLCEYQPWRSAYALICYAVCSTQTELLNAIKRFNNFRQAYKKTLVECKFFIVLSKSGTEFFRSIPTIVQTNTITSSTSIPAKSPSPIVPKKKVVEEDSISITDSSDILDFNNNNNNNPASEISSSTDEGRRDSLEKKQNFDVVTDSDIFNKTDLTFNISAVEEGDANDKAKSQEETIEDKNELNIELQNELKNLEKSIIYLEDDKIENDAKIKTVINEIVHQIYIKIYKQVDLVNSDDEKQINYYAEYLKLPTERSKLDETETSTPSLLQLKLINKKKTAGRMNKYRADLFLLLNSIDNSFIYYFKAYNTLKKEQDYLWSSSALFGLCLTSCYFLNDKNQCTTSKSVPSNLSQVKETSEADTKSKKSSKSLDVFKSKFKKQFSTSSKELEDHLIKPTDLYNNFREVLSAFNKSNDYSHLEFEFCLMMSKYFIEKNFSKTETFLLINNCIYMNSLSIKEETRVSIQTKSFH
jgi:hypothetical protein